MKIQHTEYEIGDQLLIKGTELDIERVLTVRDIRIDVLKEFGCNKTVIWYGFEQSKLMYNEAVIIRKVNK